MSLLQLLAEGQAHPLNYPPTRFLQPTGLSWNSPRVRPRNVHTLHLRLAHHLCVHECGSNADRLDDWHDEEVCLMGGAH